MFHVVCLLAPKEPTPVPTPTTGTIVWDDDDDFERDDDDRGWRGHAGGLPHRR